MVWGGACACIAGWCSLVWISDASVQVLAILNYGVEVVRPMSMDASQGAMNTYLFIYERVLGHCFQHKYYFCLYIWNQNWNNA